MSEKGAYNVRASMRWRYDVAKPGPMGPSGSFITGTYTEEGDVQDDWVIELWHNDKDNENETYVFMGLGEDTDDYEWVASSPDQARHQLESLILALQDVLERFPEK